MRGYIGSPHADITAGVFSIDRHRELISPNRCIGVQDTGGRGTDGAVLRQVMLTGDVTYGHLREVSMPTSYFDSHPSYQFPDWTDASDSAASTALVSAVPVPAASALGVLSGKLVLEAGDTIAGLASADGDLVMTGGVVEMS